MIQEQTILNVSDNSGAKKVLCIKVLGGSKKKYAYIGDLIKVSVKKSFSNSKIKNGDVLKAVVIRIKKKIYRKIDGTFISFKNNSCVLINNETNQIIGTRIFGPVIRELRNNFMKIISLSSEVI